MNTLANRYSSLKASEWLGIIIYIYTYTILLETTRLARVVSPKKYIGTSLNKGMHADCLTGQKRHMHVYVHTYVCMYVDTYVHRFNR